MKKVLAFILCLTLMTGIASMAFAIGIDYTGSILKDMNLEDLITSNETIALGAAAALLDYMLAAQRTDLLEDLDFTGTILIRNWGSYLDYYYPSKKTPGKYLNIFVNPKTATNTHYGDASTFTNSGEYEKPLFQVTMADMMVQLQALVNKLKN